MKERLEPARPVRPETPLLPRPDAEDVEGLAIVVEGMANEELEDRKRKTRDPQPGARSGRPKVEPGSRATFRLASRGQPFPLMEVPRGSLGAEVPASPLRRPQEPRLVLRVR